MFQEIDDYIACLSIEEKMKFHHKKMVKEENRYFWRNLGIEVI